MTAAHIRRIALDAAAASACEWASHGNYAQLRSAAMRSRDKASRRATLALVAAHAAPSNKRCEQALCGMLLIGSFQGIRHSPAWSQPPNAFEKASPRDVPGRSRKSVLPLRRGPGASGHPAGML